MTDVIVDTSAWILSFRSSASNEFISQLTELIDHDRVLMPGIIEAELLRGTRSEKEFRRMQDILSDIRHLKVNDEFWGRVALFGNKVLHKGINIPLVDIYIALLAIENNAELLHYDKHFDLIAAISDLKILKMAG